MIDWDDLVVGPTTTIFGEPVRYSAAGGAGFDAVGVFDDAYLGQASIETMIPGDVANTKPLLGVQLSAFPQGITPAQGDVLTVTRTGQSFQVLNAEPDGKGVAMLTLNSFTPPAPL